MDERPGKYYVCAFMNWTGASLALGSKTRPA
jgi:hypothetical protein